MVPETEGAMIDQQETKIGSIPAEWEVAVLEDLSDPDASIRYGVVQIGDDTIGGIPIVPIKHIRRIGHVELHRAAEEIERKYKNSRVAGGDILLSVKGTIGEVGIVPMGFNGNIAREIARIRLNDKCIVGYLAQQLDAPHTQRRIEKLTVGSTRLEFSIHAVKSFQVPLPPLPEQRKIADILSTWDEAIEKTEALLSNARTQKRALMQQLLTGKRRFPEFEGQPWKEVRLGDVADIRIGGTPARKEPKYWEGGTQTWLSIADLGPKFLNESKEKINEIGVAKSNVKLLPAHTVVMSFKLTIGKLGITRVPLYTNEAICGFVPKADTHFEPEFLYQLLHVTDLLEDVDQAVKGKTLNKAKLSELKVCLPSLSEQSMIAKILSELDKDTMGWESHITKLRTEKKALMQQLLTGKRRVTV